MQYVYVVAEDYPSYATFIAQQSKSCKCHWVYVKDKSVLKFGEDLTLLKGCQSREDLSDILIRASELHMVISDE